MPATDVLRGSTLDGRYRLSDLIGVGGMANVYRAHDLVLDRDVAVKLFPPTPSDDARLRQQAEIAVLSRLDDPGLVRLLDAGAADLGTGPVQAYIVMELVPGPTLADVLEEGPLAPSHVAGIGAQLARALGVVHDGQVVHRDVKPANVLLVDPEWTPEGDVPVVKLTDFGIARVADAARLTLTGLTMGTATYLSPEQAVGGAVGPPADVYALGLVLLECLTGRKAFTGTVAEVATARLTTSPAVPAGLGRAWVGLLTAMTRRDAVTRISMPDAAERLESLRHQAVPTALMPVVEPTEVLDTVPATGDGPAPVDDDAPAGDVARRRTTGGVPRAGRRVSRRWALVAVAAVAVLGAGAAAALGTGPSPGRSAVVVPAPVAEGALGDALRDLVRSVQP